MSVTYNENRRIFKLDTENTSYLIGISPEGYVGHVYYGEYLEDTDAYYLLRTEEPPFTPSVNEREKSSFLDFFPTEYPSGGVGDYRESCINVRNEAGCMGSEFFYESYEIKPENHPWMDFLRPLEEQRTSPHLRLPVLIRS